VTEAWEVGDLVITSLLLALTAGVVLAGLLGAAVGNAGVWAWGCLSGSLAASRALQVLRPAGPAPEPPESHTAPSVQQETR
jgi:hypothetical protein